jgi:uncharacterized protein
VQMQMRGKYGPRKPVASRPEQPRTEAGARRVRCAPLRTCVGCRQLGTPADLVRMVLAPDGGVAFDLAGGSMGRGAWVHPTGTCLHKAAKNTARALRADGSPDVDALMLALAAAAKRRGLGLIGAAHRARHLVVGGDACKEVFGAGKARLVVLAADAKAATQEEWLDRVAADTRLVVWSTKAELGAILGREELAVMVVTDVGLAQNLLRVTAMTIPVTSRLAKVNYSAIGAAVSARTTGSQRRQDSEDG